MDDGADDRWREVAGADQVRHIFPTIAKASCCLFDTATTFHLAPRGKSLRDKLEERGVAVGGGRGAGRRNDQLNLLAGPYEADGMLMNKWATKASVDRVQICFDSQLLSQNIDSSDKL